MNQQITSENPHFLIVGLGNPGKRYANTRHNLGFMVIDKLAERFDLSTNKIKFKTIIGLGVILDRPVILAKPQTYMNLGGSSVSSLLRYYKIPQDLLLVVYDEIDLPLGTIRIRDRGGSGGHNGMKSLIDYLGEEFARIRIGVGRPPGQMDPADYVLRRFLTSENDIVGETLDRAAEAVTAFVTKGLSVAMNQYNGPFVQL